MPRSKPLALVAVDALQRARTKSGDAAEALVAAHHDAARRLGIAHVRKLPTPMRVVGATSTPGVVRAVHAAKSGTDYVGVMLDGSARAVVAEAKRCTERRFNLGRVEEHQRVELNRATRAGAVAVLLVVYGPRHALYAVPWHAIATVRDDARADLPTSLGPDELAPHLVPDGCYLRRFVRTRGA